MFQILRYFSITSFIVIAGVAVATIFLVFFYRQITIREIIELGESRNAALAQAFANSIWPQFATYVTTVADADGNQLRANPETTRIRQAALALMKGLPVTKVKIYNLDGLTVFSTDPSEIGVIKINAERVFTAVRAGRIVSAVTHRGEINTFDGELQDRDVLESYLPVRRGNGPVEAVFELYSDITALLQRIDQVQKDLLVGLVAAFGLIYGGLFLIVRRGDMILKRQYADIFRGQKIIQAKNQELNREIVERKQAQAAILENEQRVRSIMENVADGLVTIDERGIIDSVNPATERLFGYAAEELIGENISILMPKPLRDQHDGFIQAYLASGKSNILGICPREVTGRCKDGSTIEIELSVSKVLLGGTQVFIGAMRDATARKREQTILHAAKQEAERANLAKSKFFAVASHDIRQPLHAMSLFLPLLSKRVTDRKSREIVDAIRESCDAMSGLLDALLDISKLDAGIVSPVIGSTATGHLMRSLGTEFAPQAQEKRLEFRVMAVDLWVSTDPALLSRILRNLLSNAIQNTPRGRVLFGARRRGTCLRFEVWDTGVGIAADQSDEIFQEFYQVGNRERDRAKGMGLGLGLAVVARLSMLLGHHIEVKSAPGKGSMFAVEVPMIRPESRNEVKASPAAGQVNENLAGKLVVLIEDEAAVLRGTRMTLMDGGCQVLAAESCAAALAEIASLDRWPDAILADYRLRGEETGIVAVERIRRVLGAPIPAVIITGDTDPRRISEAAAGGYALAHKPVSPETLYRFLEAAIRGERDPLKAATV